MTLPWPASGTMHTGLLCPADRSPSGPGVWLHRAGVAYDRRRHLGATPSRPLGMSPTAARPQHPFLAGGISGIIEIFITFPLEFAKSQLQLGTASYRGVRHCLTDTVRHSGFTGMYRGLSPWLLFAFPKASVRFSTYEWLIRHARSWKDGDIGVAPGDAARERPLGAGMTLGAGAVAGAVECLTVGVMMNTLCVRMVDDSNAAAPRFRGVFHTAFTIVREEGFGGIYRGVAPMMGKMMLNQSIRFGVFGSFERKFTRRDGDDGGERRPMTFVQAMMAGGSAGAVSVYATHPLDVVKTKLQGARGGDYASALDCARDVLRTRGAAGLYVGVLPRLTRVTMEVALQFSMFHAVARHLDALL